MGEENHGEAETRPSGDIHDLEDPFPAYLGQLLFGFVPGQMLQVSDWYPVVRRDDGTLGMSPRAGDHSHHLVALDDGVDGLLQHLRIDGALIVVMPSGAYAAQRYVWIAALQVRFLELRERDLGGIRGGRHDCSSMVPISIACTTCWVFLR